MSDEVIAMLVVPNDYVRYINRVAGLTTRDIIFLKRKFVSKSGYELAKHPIDQCASIAYFDERPIWIIVSGVLITALMAFIFVELASDWSRLQVGLKTLAFFMIAAGYGVRRIIGSRRHRLVFTMLDQTRLTWASRAGEFEQWKPSTQQIVDYARARGLLKAG